jgi:hypothetical protein
MQRTTSFEPILCNLCVEETRSFYREDCEKCEMVTCNDCLCDYTEVLFNKKWCYDCYDEWFTSLNLLEKQEVYNKLVEMGLMSICNICNIFINNNMINTCSSIYCIQEFERERNRLENNTSPKCVIDIIYLHD